LIRIFNLTAAVCTLGTVGNNRGPGLALPVLGFFVAGGNNADDTTDHPFQRKLEDLPYLWNLQYSRLEAELFVAAGSLDAQDKYPTQP
jgi:hypothetical protein